MTAIKFYTTFFFSLWVSTLWVTANDTRTPPLRTTAYAYAYTIIFKLLALPQGQIFLHFIVFLSYFVVFLGFSCLVSCVDSDNFPNKSIFFVIAYGQKISSRTRTVKNFQRVRVRVQQKSPRTPRTRTHHCFLPHKCQKNLNFFEFG